MKIKERFLHRVSLLWNTQLTCATVTNVYAPLKGTISDGPETPAFGRTEGRRKEREKREGLKRRGRESWSFVSWSAAVQGKKVVGRWRNGGIVGMILNWKPKESPNVFSVPLPSASENPVFLTCSGKVGAMHQSTVDCFVFSEYVSHVAKVSGDAGLLRVLRNNKLSRRCLYPDLVKLCAFTTGVYKRFKMGPSDQKVVLLLREVTSLLKSSCGFVLLHLVKAECPVLSKWDEF
ncbi:hypothetical protein WN51_11898 [Melipona quadrifasciata]|uniref:Uncharacterized protein n=1 Tax=Melipona quadrifasciata TaxID=166423 RepID=A0A0N1ITS5_9HYME|nr:hypothetical protein WN51_11898 [Melipona quadrifasciata]